LPLSIYLIQMAASLPKKKGGKWSNDFLEILLCEISKKSFRLFKSYLRYFDFEFAQNQNTSPPL
jgi:hypothetical protein